MKDLFKRNSRQVTTGSASGSAAPATSKDVQAFLGKLASLPRNAAGEARLLFALDATASRQATWDQASKLQRDMFVSTQSLGSLNIQLCHFRGLAGFHSTGWHTDPDKLLAHMSGIRCEAGLTQIGRLLLHAIDENTRQRVKAVVFIGDAVEENPEYLCQLAGKLGLLNVPIFLFQEQSDPAVRQVFQQIARLSGGAHCQFDTASADQLRDLLKAVAIYATGGRKALDDFSKLSHDSVKLLGRQLK